MQHAHWETSLRTKADYKIKDDCSTIHCKKRSLSRFDICAARFCDNHTGAQTERPHAFTCRTHTYSGHSILTDSWDHIQTTKWHADSFCSHSCCSKRSLGFVFTAFTSVAWKRPKGQFPENDGWHRCLKFTVWKVSPVSELVFLFLIDNVSQVVSNLRCKCTFLIITGRKIKIIKPGYMEFTQTWSHWLRRLHTDYT